MYAASVPVASVNLRWQFLSNQGPQRSAELFEMRSSGPRDAAYVVHWRDRSERATVVARFSHAPLVVLTRASSAPPAARFGLPLLGL